MVTVTKLLYKLHPHHLHIFGVLWVIFSHSLVLLLHQHVGDVLQATKNRSNDVVATLFLYCCCCLMLWFLILFLNHNLTLFHSWWILFLLLCQVYLKADLLLLFFVLAGVLQNRFNLISATNILHLTTTLKYSDYLLRLLLKVKHTVGLVKWLWTQVFFCVSLLLDLHSEDPRPLVNTALDPTTQFEFSSSGGLQYGLHEDIVLVVVTVLTNELFRSLDLSLR